MLSYKYQDEILDIHPKSWLSPYRKTTIFYLLKMAVFYIAIALVLVQIGSIGIEKTIPNYQNPDIKIPIISGIVAGPTEDTLFFGIPFYLSGNPYVVLLTGILWSVSHIMNTKILAYSSLAYPTVLFTIPWIFFTLRTWRSGKGWFAIIIHSSWDVSMLTMSCLNGTGKCDPVETPDYWISTIESVSLAVALLLVTYVLYKRKQKAKLVIDYHSIPIMQNMRHLKIRSKLWYLLPIFFSLIGGLIAYAIIKNDDSTKAKRCLFIGILMLAVSIGYSIVKRFYS